MLVYCSTTKAVVLATLTGSDGIVRCLSADATQPGFIFEPKPLIPIVEQIVAQLKNTLDDSGPANAALKFQVRGDYSDQFSLSDGTTATLYIASASTSLPSTQVVQGTWIPFPDMLRSMPKDRMRLVYLRAWQVLLGALQDSTKAIDMDEAMRHLKGSTSDQH